MSYIPLARKYRPGTFADLVGQTTAAEALANSIRLGREPHAIIFTGVRGVGKTTCARLYAKALNCEKGPTPDPCNQCESCLAINEGTHEDVMEIDGASNTGVDDVRSLRETVNYVPQRSKFKIYIVDEVHMLSQSAFNAMLKTLEEPPVHVVFVFATTEFDRIPETIVSRCQVLFLKKFSMDDIRKRLVQVLDAEKIPYDLPAVATIAREGKGSMRDALTHLDFAVALGGGKVTLDSIPDLLQSSSPKEYIPLLAALLDRDRGSILERLHAFYDRGIEPETVAEQLATFARHAFIMRDVGTNHIDIAGLGYGPDELTVLSELAKKAAPLDLNRIFRTLLKCRTDMDGSDLDRFVLENYCLEWCLDPGLPGAIQLLLGHKAPLSAHPSTTANAAVPRTSGAPLKSLKEAVQATIAQPPSLPPSAQPSSPSSAPPSAPPSSPPPSAPVQSAVAPASTSQAPHPTSPSSTGPQASSVKGFPSSWREFVDRWKELKPLQARKLEEAHPVCFSAEKIELHVPAQSYASASLLRADEQARLKGIFSDLFGFSGQLIIKGVGDASAGKVESPDTKNSQMNNQQAGRQGASAAQSSPAAQQSPQAASPPSPLVPPLPPPLPETLAQQREREEMIRRQKLEQEAREHPVTQEIIRLFDATIENVQFRD